MPVRPTNFVAWPNRTIPYENNSAAQQLLGAIGRFNQAIGFPLFQPRNGEAHYVQFGFMGHSHSPIGYKSTAAQSISVSGPQSNNTIHEMGHAAGLGHEHLHPNFPMATCRTAWVKLMLASRKDYKESFVDQILYPREFQQQAQYAEIRFLDYAMLGWNPVRMDQNTMLPGGRYMYICT